MVQKIQNDPIFLSDFSDQDDLVSTALQATRTGRALSDFRGPKYTEPELDPSTGLLCVFEKEDGEVESLSREPQLDCTHSTQTTCHYTYVTQFESVSEEVCEEVFEKKCQITFDKEAFNETVTQCRRPMEIRDVSVFLATMQAHNDL